MRFSLFPLSVILASAVTVPAIAAGPGYRAEGTFERKGPYSQSAKIIVIDAPDQFAASFSTGISGCGGGVGMNGRAHSASEILFTKKDDSGGLCRITVKFSPNFRSVKVSEDGCLYWHGASCDFEGTLKRTSN